LTFEPNKIYRKNFALFRDFLWRKIWRENYTILTREKKDEEVKRDFRGGIQRGIPRK